MKKLSFVFTVILSLVALAPLAVAKDKDKDKDKKKHHDEDKDRKETRNAVRQLQELYKRLQDAVQYMGGSRSLAQNANAIGGEVSRVSQQYDSGNYDRRDLERRISQLTNDIERTRQQVVYENQRRAAYESERRGGYDYRNREYHNR